MKYYRVRCNQGKILDGASVPPVRVTSHMDGVFGVTDIRFINAYGCYRRITGAMAKKIVAFAETTNQKVYCGGFGQKPDYNLYDVPLQIITEFDPQSNIHIIDV